MSAPESAQASRGSAERVGLVYTSDTEPGYRRRRARDEFVYIGLSGTLIRRAGILQRIRRLAIPPAYTDVWICPQANGHLQATGRDARGRKQYRYHARWREARDTSKYHRMLAFAEHLPALRAGVAADLRLQGLPRRKVLAAVVSLLEASLIRVGNEEYSRSNGSFGLTTLKNRHVRVRGESMHFSFRGKSGKFHDVSLDDSRLARIVRRCQELPGQTLFQFRDSEGKTESVDSNAVNAYIRELAGDDFSAKDFRTWAGTLLTARALNAAGFADSEADAKARIADAITGVAKRLGNTPAICRKCYVHPAVLDAFVDRSLKLPGAGKRRAKLRLSVQERALKNLLRKNERRASRVGRTKAPE